MYWKILLTIVLMRNLATFAQQNLSQSSKPCVGYHLKDVLPVPNAFINKFNVTSIKSGSDIRLNVTFNANKEYSHDTAFIKVTAYNTSCDHPEEYEIQLNESWILIPRSETPKFHLQPTCEYIIEIEFERQQYCSYKSYTTPDHNLCVAGHECECTANSKGIEIIKVDRVKRKVYDVFWKPTGTKIENIDNYHLKFYCKNDFDEFQEVDTVHENYSSVINISYFEDDHNLECKIHGFFNDSDPCFTDTIFTVSSKAQTAKSQPFFNMMILLILVPILVTVLCCKFRTNIPKKVIDKLKVLTSLPNDTARASHISARQEVENMLYIPIEMENLKRYDAYEFPRSKISNISFEPIGHGAFGKVYFAKAFNICSSLPGFSSIAIKMLSEPTGQREEENFLEEMETLKKIGNHPNIVRLLGCCTDKKPYLMLMEYVPSGDLKHYLEQLRLEWAAQNSLRVRSTNSECSYVTPNRYPIRNQLDSTSSDNDRSVRLSESSELTEYTVLEDEESRSSIYNRSYSEGITPILDSNELKVFALQIARGMAHLEKMSITHRDLAARNILINEYKTLKISDFGMARSGTYVNHTLKKVPLRWMAIESIEDKIFTSKSDVWSFGIVLWEIGTLGAFPYDNIQDNLLLYELKCGRRLECPEICSEELYAIMEKCWCENPDNRLSFHELLNELQEKKKIYVDFCHLNPTYVFPPSK